jgi:hypothetical protein
MAITSNVNTTQASMQALGRTGVQSVKFIPAPRVYITLPVGTGSVPVPSVISNGVTPDGFIDLGAVSGNVKIDYVRKVVEVTTGIDNYFRGAYGGGTTNTVEFYLEQFDDVVLENITGLASTIISNAVANYQTGQGDLQQLSLLLVVQNKFDGKEFQFFNPNTYLNFSFENSGDDLMLKCTGYLPYFTAASQPTESIMSVTVFSANAVTVVPVAQGFGSDAWGSTPYDAPPAAANAGYSASQWGTALYGQ